MFKRIVILSISCMLVGGSIVSAAETSYDNNINIQDEADVITEIDVYGKTFSYENAPEKVKDEYEKNCKAVGKIPSANDEIFISLNNFEKYDISQLSRAVEGYNLRYSEGYIYVTGARTYTINTNTTYVGYNYITSGNAVHCLQVLLDIFVDQYGVGSPVSVDSLFGPNTQTLLLKFQSYAGLSADGIAGPNTWNTLSRYVMK